MARKHSRDMLYKYGTNPPPGAKYPSCAKFGPTTAKVQKLQQYRTTNISSTSWNKKQNLDTLKAVAIAGVEDVCKFIPEMHHDKIKKSIPSVIQNVINTKDPYHFRNIRPVRYASMILDDLDMNSFLHWGNNDRREMLMVDQGLAFPSMSDARKPTLEKIRAMRYHMLKIAHSWTTPNPIKQMNLEDFENATLNDDGVSTRPTRYVKNTSLIK